MVKLVAADMDGTFLTSNGYFDSKRLHDVLEKFKKKQYTICRSERTFTYGFGKNVC